MKTGDWCDALPRPAIHRRARSVKGGLVRVLVVEDERRLADLIARGLREAGHAVQVCHTATAGWSPGS
jgi:hypothetical protein